MQLIKVLGQHGVAGAAGQGTDKAITHCGTHKKNHYGAHCAALSIRIRLVRNVVQSKPL